MSDTGSNEDIAASVEVIEIPSVHGCLSTISTDQTVLHPTRQQYYQLISDLKADGYEMCIDLCAVDYLAHPRSDLPPSIEAQRFEVVANLLSFSLRSRIRVRVQIPEDEPAIESLFPLYPGSEAMEREAFDMIGINFIGHPDLTRILMPEDWEGHPLSKDYGVGQVPVQFKAARGPR